MSHTPAPASPEAGHGPARSTSEGHLTVGDVVALVEAAAPPGLAASWDSNGLICGDPAEPVRSILARGRQYSAADLVDAQTRLLRVLQTGEFTTVGGARTIRADVRIVAATNRDLEAQVAAGLFREDLFYRLNVVPLELPSLRERGEDVALLARHFLDQAAVQGLPRRQLSTDAVALLMAHDWPGNVREMENLMRRLAVLARDAVIDAEAIRGLMGAPRTPSEPAEAGFDQAVRALLDRLGREAPAGLDDGTLYDRVIAEVERPLIAAMLARHGGNQLRAARALGINRNTLRKRLDDWGIDLPKS